MKLFQTRSGHLSTQTLAPESFTIPLLRPDKWMEEAAEGELSVDVYETKDQFVVQATVAGVDPAAITLSIHRDLLTIRGERTRCAPHVERSYLVEECFWGRFSRSVLLPEPVDASRSQATVKTGVLTIVLPKAVERNEILITNENED